MMAHRRRIRRLAALAACAFTIAQFTSCFSERAETTGVPTNQTCEVPLSALGAKKTIVAIRSYTFFPDTLRISAGTTVTFVNCDDIAGNDAHTSTSNSGVWSSSLFKQGETYTAPTFNNAGAFPYHCEPHPNMRGTIIVQ